MRRYVLALALAATPFLAHAEEKVCTVDGMHCQGCKEMIEGKVCDETKYSTCEIKILDEKKQIGEIRLVTKDAAAKIDEKAIGALVTDSGYKMKPCKASGRAKRG